jgi:cell division protein FtsB
MPKNVGGIYWFRRQLFWLGLFLSFVLIYLTGQINVIRLTQDIVKTEKQNELLKRENESLQIQINQATSLEQLEQSAQNILRMSEPGRVVFLKK